MIASRTIVGNRYHVVRPLGGGGMKQVYLAEDSRLGNRLCALAEMIEHLANLAEHQAATQAFAREAEMLARLDHPRIPHVFDHFSEQNHHYLVMQYVEGETLEERLTKFSYGLDEQTVIDIGCQVLEALEYLHSRTPPVVFRDLKPSNLIIASDGLVKLIDFGIARHFQPKKTATMVGTQGYAPPEQYEGKAEPRSDLYSLGVTLFQLLTAWDPTVHSPFSFPQLRQLRPDCSAALAELIGEALMMEPSQRIASAAEFRKRLQGLKNGPQPVVVTPLVAEPTPPAPVHLVAPSAARCPRCARTIPPDASLCPYCGAGLMQPPSAAQEKTVLMSPELRKSRAGHYLIAAVVTVVLVGTIRAGIHYLREQRDLAEAIRYSHQLFDQVERCGKTPSCNLDALLSATRDGKIRLAANLGDTEAESILEKKNRKAAGERKVVSALASKAQRDSGSWRVLADFRKNGRAAPNLPAGIGTRVLPLLFRSYLTDVDHCRFFENSAESDRKTGQIVPEILDKVTGSFTAGGADETAYVIAVHECDASHAENFGTDRLAILSSGKLVVDMDTGFLSQIELIAPFKRNGVDVLLMVHSDENQGVIQEGASLVDFARGRLHEVQDFGNIVYDDCNSGRPGSTRTVSVIYYTLKPEGLPAFKIEHYRAPCGNDSQWKFVRNMPEE